MRCYIEGTGRSYGGLIQLKHRRQKIVPIGEGGFELTYIEKFIGQSLVGFLMEHPCIGARAVISWAADRGDQETRVRAMQPETLYYSVYETMSSVTDAVLLLSDLEKYLSFKDRLHPIYRSFIAVFSGDLTNSITAYAERYWAFVQLLSDLSLLTHAWPEGAPTDPAHDSFELCIAGTPIFTSTLHPNSDRLSKRFGHASWIVVELDQFDRIRAQGVYETWQSNIRERDAAVDYSRSANPMLADHGKASAAPQLGGVHLDPCPYKVLTSPRKIIERGEALLAQAVTEGAPPEVIAEIQSRLTIAQNRFQSEGVQ